MSPWRGVEFTITEADGTVVDDNNGMTSSMGLYRTDENGRIIIDGLVGTFIIHGNQDHRGLHHP